MPRCRRCGKDKNEKSFSYLGSEVCRRCSTAPSISKMRKAGIEQRYPDVACPNCGDLVQNLIRHFRQDHPEDLGKLHLMCEASKEPVVLELNQRILKDRAIVDRDCMWDPNTPVVYFIQAGVAGRPIKIGYAAQLASRMVSLQLSSPEPMEVLLSVGGGRELEKGLHSKFSHLRIHQEWFRAENTLLEEILEMSLTHPEVPLRKRGSLYVGPKRERKGPHFTYLECQAMARELGVQTADHWRLLHKANKLPDGMLWNLPRSYPLEWKGWSEFLGGTQRVERVEPLEFGLPKVETPELTYLECQQVARDLVVISSEHWVTLYKSEKLPKGAPWNLPRAYPYEWRGWTEFFAPSPKVEMPPMVFDDPPFEDSADMSLDDLLRASGLSLD
jgi:hypothetical protein